MAVTTYPKITGESTGGTSVVDSKFVRTTRFASIGAGTSGAVTLPANSTVVLDDLGGTVDAVISQMSSLHPTFASAVDASGVIITTSFDSSGNYVLSGTPSAYPVAIIYRVQQTFANFDSTSGDIIYGIEVVPGDGLRSANNLLDVSNIATARTNLGLAGTAGGAWKQIAVSNVAINNTGNITENQVLSFTIPAGTLSANATIVSIVNLTSINNANTKSCKIRFNGTNIFQTNVTTSLSAKSFHSMHFRNSLSSQISGALGSGVGSNFGVSSGALVTYAVDFTLSVTVTVHLQCVTVGTDNIQLETFSLMVIDT